MTCWFANKKGFTLIEMLVYVSLVTLIGLAIVAVVSQLISFNTRTEATAESLDNAQSALAVITREVRHANNVYTPTSVFSSSAGQLSLETTQNVPAGENSTYIDFYVDDGRLYVKREGQAAELLVSERVRVSNFTVTHLDAGEDIPAVRIELTVEPASDSAIVSQANVSLVATASLRSYE